MGWDFLLDGINAALSLGPRNTRSVGLASFGSVYMKEVGEGDRNEAPK